MSPASKMSRAAAGATSKGDMMCRTLAAVWLAVLLWAGRSPALAGRIIIHQPGQARIGPPVHCTGRVADPKGHPIEGAKVGLYRVRIRPGQPGTVLSGQEVITRADGAFAFEQEVPQEHEAGSVALLLASKQGLALGCGNWDLSEDRRIEIEMGPPADLEGQVVDPCGAPLAEALVRIDVMEVIHAKGQPRVIGAVSEALFTRRTDRDGRFRFQCLPPNARAALSVEKAGWGVHGMLEPGPHVPLVATVGQTCFQVVLVPQARIEGILTERATGRGVGGMRLCATRTEDTGVTKVMGRPVTSAGDGSFQILGLWPGRYAVGMAESEDDAPEGVARPVEVRIEIGQTVSKAHLEMMQGGTLEVSVTDAETRVPLDDVEVIISGTGGNRGFHRAIRTQRGASRARLLPGEYLIYLEKQGYPHGYPDTAIEVEDGQAVRREYVLGWTGTLHGLAQDKAGQPVEGARIEIIGVQGQQAVTDGQGRFTLRWSLPGSTGNTNTWLLGRHEALNLAAVERIDSETRQIELPLMPGMALTGQVTTAAGDPVAQAQVSVIWWGSNRFPIHHTMFRSDQNGRFKVTAIPEMERCTIRAIAFGHGEAVKEIPWQASSRGPLELGQIRLAAANMTVSGVVVDANDNPLVGAVVQARQGEQLGGRSTLTDAQGRFSLGQLCPGPVQVRALARLPRAGAGTLDTETGAEDIRIIVRPPPGVRPRTAVQRPASLLASPLPSPASLGLDNLPGDCNDRPVVILFWDMQQRPSRQGLKELAQQHTLLNEHGAALVAIHMPGVDQTEVAQWLADNRVPFKALHASGDPDKIRLGWGIKALPWLILTDRNHVVMAEGFAWRELGEKLGGSSLCTQSD